MEDILRKMYLEFIRHIQDDILTVKAIVHIIPILIVIGLGIWILQRIFGKKS